MKIFPLKAKHGDAIIIEFASETKQYTIVIDGGPAEIAGEIADAYDYIGYIDIMILTHYDEDHISGLIEYFSRHNKDKDERIGQVWVNGTHLIYYDDDVNTTAYDNAYNLTKCLSHLKNNGFIGQWVDNITNEMPPFITKDYRIDILSPTREILETLEKEFNDYVEEHGLQDDPDIDEEVSYSRVLADSNKALDELSAKSIKSKTTFMNTTSIAILLQAEEKKVLLLGDADANVVTDSLIKLQCADETIQKPVVIDLMKMPHHGSKANINDKLLSLIDCHNFLFTTNGGKGGAYHPDRRTLAYIMKYSKSKNGNKVNLWFNYPLSLIEQRNIRLLSDEEKKLFNIIDSYTGDTQPIIKL